MSTTKEILIAAKAKIATRETWTQDATARDASGKPTYATDPNAVCWCALGAIQAVVDGIVSGLMAYSALDRCADGDAIDVNDYDGFEAVHAAFDRAIEEASKYE